MAHVIRLPDGPLPDDTERWPQPNTAANNHNFNPQRDHRPRDRWRILKDEWVHKHCIQPDTTPRNPQHDLNTSQQANYALDQLTPAEREAAKLIIMELVPIRTAAELLGISYPACQQRIYRARKHLRALAESGRLGRYPDQDDP